MSATYCGFPSGGVSTFFAVTKYLTKAASKEGRVYFGSQLKVVPFTWLGGGYDSRGLLGESV